MPRRFDLITASILLLFAGVVAFIWLRAAFPGWVPEYAEAFNCPDLALAASGLSLFSEGINVWVLRLSANIASGVIFQVAGFSSGMAFLCLLALHTVATALVVGLARALNYPHRLALLAGLLFFAPALAMQTFALRFVLETLTLIAFLCTCLGFIRRRLATSRPRALAWGGLEVFGLLLGLLSKETFPACFGLLVIAELTVVRPRRQQTTRLRQSLLFLVPHALVFALIAWLQRGDVQYMLQFDEYAVTLNPLQIAANIHRLLTPPLLAHIPYYGLQAVVLMALLLRVRTMEGFLLAAPLIAALPMALFENRYTVAYSYLPWAFMSLAIAGAVSGLRGYLPSALVGVGILAVLFSTYRPGEMEYETERAADCYRTVIWGLETEGEEVCEPEGLPPTFKRRPGAAAPPVEAPLWYVPRGVWDQDGCFHKVPRRLAQSSYLTTRSMDDGCFFAYVVALWCDTKVARAVLVR